MKKTLLHFLKFIFTFIVRILSLSGCFISAIGHLIFFLAIISCIIIIFTEGFNIKDISVTLFIAFIGFSITYLKVCIVNFLMKQLAKIEFYLNE